MYCCAAGVLCERLFHGQNEGRAVCVHVSPLTCLKGGWQRPHDGHPAWQGACGAELGWGHVHVAHGMALRKEYFG